MKTIVLSFVCLSLFGCSAMLARKPVLPEGTTACNSDAMCPSNYRCGFDGVDQVPHCIYSYGNDFASFR